MHPTPMRSNKSSLQTTIPSTTSSVLHQHQQQQQQFLYGPVTNPMVTLQPCNTGLHPPYIYPGPQRNTSPSNPTPLQTQGKNNRWQSKNKLPRGQQQYYQQQHSQQQLSYTSKPFVLFDQAPSSGPAPPSTSSFLLASSTVTHGPFPGEHYNNSGVTLVPPPYYKPPELQTFCLVQDRQNTQQPQQPQAAHGSYYNISATNATCSLQTVNSNAPFQLPNLSPYAAVTAYTNNQISGPVQAVQSTQLYPTPPINLVFNAPPREKTSISTFDVSSFKCARSKLTSVTAGSKILPNSRADNYSDWPPQTIETSSMSLFDSPIVGNNNKNSENVDNSIQNVASNVTKTQEEHYSDDSSTSFDFTIEAEKMVSALCNTTSCNDLVKDEGNNCKTDPMSLFSGAGDNVSNKTSWYTDFCTEFNKEKSVAVQTDGPCEDTSQYPELIRKTAYWGCTEAEKILDANNLEIDFKRNWLTNLSSATRTAITKSSTCFSIFAGDRIFAHDLINALLRVSNGWLILDNYLNKQHYQGFNEKVDKEFIRCFHFWEESTYELLKYIVQTFTKLEEQNASSSFEQKTEAFNTSFPGDVSLYTNYDLFNPMNSSSFRQQDLKSKSNNYTCGSVQSAPTPLSTEGMKNFRYLGESQQQQSTCQKETKLRSKWTITENLIPSLESTKSVPDVFLGNSDANAPASSRFRSKGLTSTKANTSKQSLNAEFFHLRSKVMENTPDISRHWGLKERKLDFFTDNKVPSSCNAVEPPFRFQRPTQSGNVDGAYVQRYNIPRIDATFPNPTSTSLETGYHHPNSNTSVQSSYECNYGACGPYSTPEYNYKICKHPDQGIGKPINIDSVYIGKSSTDQLELAAVPRNKMTLLSQIEPSTTDKESDEMTANLSAWFASIRNVGNQRHPFVQNTTENRTCEGIVPRTSGHQESSRNMMDLSRQFHFDTNRQLQTLQNMQSIQSAPWTALNLISNRVQFQHVPEEYDSSEDVRVYMKPGSYNVPKKRHQRRSNRRQDNSSVSRNTSGRYNLYLNKEKAAGSAASSISATHTTISTFCTVNDNSAVMKISAANSVTSPSTFPVQNSPRILKRLDSSNTNAQQDVTWKAACASAEILLEALNVKDSGQSPDVSDSKKNNDGKINDNANNNEKNVTLEIVRQDESQIESELPKRNDNCAGASSYEASEDDSGSTSKLSPSTSIIGISLSEEKKHALSKMNVKTDSWLIRTLNNASIVSKKKIRQGTADLDSTESSNSSLIDNEQATCNSSLAIICSSTTAPTSSTIEIKQNNDPRQDSLNSTSKTNQASKDNESFTGKATYSETLRRCTASSSSGKKDSSKKGKLSSSNISIMCNTTLPIPGRKCQRKDSERPYHLLYKSRKSSSKKMIKNPESTEQYMEEESAFCASSKSLKSHRKKDINSGILEGKMGKPGDRGWSVWYSSKKKPGLSPLAISKLENIHQTFCQMDESHLFKYPTSGKMNDEQTVENYCKVVSNPIFLETIGYKLKNHVYHNIEHVVNDFRRMIYNTKFYYKDNDDRLKTIETLSKKLEELFEEHFARWDFGEGSPRETSPVQSQRFRSVSQKSFVGCFNTTKKSPPSSTAIENAPYH